MTRLIHSRIGRNPFRFGVVVLLAARRVSHSRAGRNPFRSGFVIVVARLWVSRSRAGCHPLWFRFSRRCLRSSGDSLARFNLRFIL